MTQPLRRTVGSLLVVGLESASLSALERAWLRTVQPGGIILFRRNIADAAQSRALLTDAAAFCAPHALRCVDVEGGTVDRLRDALAPTPSAQAVAAADRQSPRKSPKPADAGNKTFAYQHGVLIGRGVRAFGFNVTLAPVLDLALPESSGVMGARTAGATAAEVVSFARAFLAGLASESIAGCGKHFPGLGGGMRDSHLETPEIARSWGDLWREDIAPYRELSNLLPMVMVNHAAYPRTPGKHLPTTASAFWITKVLRNKLGYRGLIFSDDMEMGGILKSMPMEEAVLTAVRCGMDMLEICHSPELILRAYESLLQEAERSTSFRTLIQTRARESARKRRRIAAPSANAPSAKQLDALRMKMQRFREQVLAIAGDASQPAGESKSVVETA